MTGNGDDLDALRGLAHSASCEEIGERHAGPDLLAPPSAGAIEHNGCLAARQRGEFLIGELGWPVDGAGYAEAPGIEIDHRNLIQAPDRHREGVPGERAGVT